MDLPFRAAPKHVPVLTEVIESVDLVPAAAPPGASAPLVTEPAPAATTQAVLSTAEPAPALYTQSLPLLDVPALHEAIMVAALPAVDEAQIAQRVLAEVQRQIDGMLEYRLREALTPILARVSDGLVRELRQELSRTMSDVVARSVAQEVARQRSRH